MENQWLDKHWPNWRWWGMLATDCAAITLAVALLWGILSVSGVL